MSAIHPNNPYYFNKRARKALIKLYGPTCWICGREVIEGVKNSKRGASLDHIIPKSLEGTNEGYNLALTCRRCNSAKSDRLDVTYRFRPLPLV